MNGYVEVKPVVVTPDQAKEWLEHNVFESQRKLRPAHVVFLAGEMKSGRFRRGTPIEFGVLNGKPFLVNGQHTLSAVVQSGQSVELIMVTQPVPSEEALGWLYNTHDSGLARTWVDAYAALKLNSKFNMTDSEVNAYGRAAPFIGGCFGYREVKEFSASRNRDARISVMEAYHDAARTYLDCLLPAEPAIRKALMLAPCFALGTYTVANDKERATQFWTLAADDQNLTKADPPKVATMLAQRPTNYRQRAMVGLAQSLVLIWNSHCLGKPIKLTKKGEPPALITKPADVVRILGTPLAEPEAGLTEAATPEQEEAFEKARDAFGTGSA